MPELRFPTILASDSPISSPEKLQAIVDLPYVPQVTMATEVELLSDDEVEPVDGKEVQICDVYWKQVEKLKTIPEWEEAIVFLEEKQRRWVQLKLSL